MANSRRYGKVLVLTLLFAAFSFANLLRAQAPLLRLKMYTPNFYDETVLYFQQGSDTLFQPSYDAYKLVGPTTIAYIGSNLGNVLTSIKSLPPLPLQLSIPIKVITTASGMFSFSVSAENFPSNTCVQLEDLYTSAFTNICTTAYTCTLSDTTQSARFVLHLYFENGQAQVQANSGSCAHPTQNAIVAKGDDIGPWNYTWYKADSLYKSSTGLFSADSITQLLPGTYKVKIEFAGSCKYFENEFEIAQPTVPNAVISLSSTIFSLSSGWKVDFKNDSENAAEVEWKFGDGSTSQDYSPEHIYQEAGDYAAVLKVTSQSGCSDSATVHLKMLNDLVEVSEHKKDSKIDIKKNGQKWELHYSALKGEVVQISIFDSHGKMLDVNNLDAAKSRRYEVPLEQWEGNTFVLRVNVGKERRAYYVQK